MKEKNGIKIVWYAIVAVIIALGVWGGVSYRNNQNKNQTPATTTSATVQPAKSIAYSGEDGKTVYDILKLKYQVEATEGSYGVMVNSINGLKATDKEFWLYSVSGKSGDIAADKQATKSSDTILWEYKGF